MIIAQNASLAKSRDVGALIAAAQFRIWPLTGEKFTRAISALSHRQARDDKFHAPFRQ
jgi:hypothetical protein